MPCSHTARAAKDNVARYSRARPRRRVGLAEGAVGVDRRICAARARLCDDTALMIAVQPGLVPRPAARIGHQRLIDPRAMHVTALHRVRRGAVILGDQIAPVIEQTRRARDRCAERHDDRVVVERRVEGRRSSRAQAIVAVVGVCPLPVAGEIGLSIIRERAGAGDAPYANGPGNRYATATYGGWRP